MPLDPFPDWVLMRRRVIGDRIRAARLYANLTQPGLAERVGVDRRTVGAWEAGTSDPPLSRLLLLARALDVPLAELVRE